LIDYHFPSTTCPPDFIKYVEMYYTPGNGGPSFQAPIKEARYEMREDTSVKMAADPLLPPEED